MLAIKNSCKIYDFEYALQNSKFVPNKGNDFKLESCSFNICWIKKSK